MSVIKSASLVLLSTARHTAPRGPSHSPLFYELVMLQRTRSSQSFPSKLVFPGGALDPADCSDQWLDLVGDREALVARLACRHRLALYRQSDRLASALLPPELFYRICAIRETFEETGILLALDDTGAAVWRDKREDGQDSGGLLDEIRRHRWQQRVSAHGDAFIDLFRSFGLRPDVAGLHEWAEWLTPPFVDRRFHTAFFVAALHHSLPATSLNEAESLSLSWTTPAAALDQHLPTRSLAPPQIAELFELNTLYPDWETLETELERRGQLGGLKNVAVRIVLSDGALFVLPGDCRYPVVGDGDDYEGAQVIERRDLRVEDLEGDERQRRCLVKDGQFLYKYNLNETIEQ